MLAPQLTALGFLRNPFPQTPDADCYFRTETIEQQLSEVQHCLLTGKGFALLTGEVGTGKSTFLRCLIDQLLAADCRLAYVFNTFLQGRDLLLAINRDFGLAPGADMADDLDRLNRFLIEANGRGQTCVVLIDDAQNFDIATLELVRLLSNLETRQHKLLQIVLSGQPELAQLLAHPSIRQLTSRIVQHVHLTCMSAADCVRYIDFRITRCLGAAAPVTLTDAAQRTLYRQSGGNPRRMHLLLDRCLYGLVTQGERRIDADLIKTAATEAGMGPRSSVPQLLRGMRPSMRAAAAAAVAVYGIALAASAVMKHQAAPVAVLPLAAVSTSVPAGTELGTCLAALNASAWQPVLQTGLNTDTRAAVAHALAAHGLALAARPAHAVDLPAPHCAWRDQAGAWLLWRPVHAALALQADAPADATRRLQQRLAAAGLYRQAIDGVPGPHTRAALAAFRASQGLPRTAELDAATLLLLEQSTVPAGTLMAAHSVARMVK